MKKVIIVVALILVASLSFAQKIEKGSLLGIHIMTINLNPNVTMDQFKNFYISKVIPEYEKQFNAKGFLVKSVRGENENSFGIVWLFENEQARDKFFNTDGTPNDFGKSAIEKVNPIDKELTKLGTHTTKYNDWVVQ